MAKNPGYLVTTKRGLQGRTYHSKGLINGKVPVYLLMCHICGGEGEHTFDCSATIGGFSMVSDKAMLCEQDSLTMKGFID